MIDLDLHPVQVEQLNSVLEAHGIDLATENGYIRGGGWDNTSLNELFSDLFGELGVVLDEGQKESFITNL